MELEAEANGGQYMRPHPTFTNKPVLLQSMFAFVRESILVVTRRVIQGVALRVFPPQRCRKLIKHVPRSALRKYERVAWKEMGRLSRACKMGVTAARAAIINNLGEFCVASALATFATWRLYALRKSGALGPLPPRLETIPEEGENSETTEGEEEGNNAEEEGGNNNDGGGGGTGGLTTGTRTGGNRDGAVAAAAMSGFAEGEAFGTWCKLVTAHLVKAGVTISMHAVLAGCVALVTFDEPKWAYRLMLISGVGGDFIGATVAGECNKFLRLH